MHGITYTTMKNKLTEENTRSVPMTTSDTEEMSTFVNNNCYTGIAYPSGKESRENIPFVQPMRSVGHCRQHH